MINNKKLEYTLITLIFCMCFVSCAFLESSSDAAYKEEIKGLPNFDKENEVINIDGVEYVKSNWETSLEIESTPFGIVNDCDYGYYKTILYYYVDDTQHDFIEYDVEIDYGSGFTSNMLVKNDIAQSIDFKEGYEAEVVGYKIKEGMTQINAYNHRNETTTVINSPDVLEEITNVINQNDNIIYLTYESRENVVGRIILHDINNAEKYWRAELVEYNGNIYIELQIKDMYQYKLFPEESLLIQILNDLRK